MTDQNPHNADHSNSKQTEDGEGSRVPFSVLKEQDDLDVRKRYRPFLLSDDGAADDWVANLELELVMKIVRCEILERGQDRLRILILYGSVRCRQVRPKP